MGYARSSMTNLLKDCYFNSFCKDRKNFVPSPREFESTVYASPFQPMNQGTHGYSLTKKTEGQNLVRLSL
jgi:hypothetical protein